MTKKLTSDEQRALRVLAKLDAIVLGDTAACEFGAQFLGLLRSLARKGRATVEATDDGPRFAINAAGRKEAGALFSDEEIGL